LRKVEHIQTFRDLWPQNRPIYTAFQRLSSARNWIVGTTAQPVGIAPSEIIAYGVAHGYARTLLDLEEFENFIYGMEEVYMKWWSDRAEEKRLANQRAGVT